MNVYYICVQDQRYDPWGNFLKYYGYFLGFFIFFLMPNKHFIMRGIQICYFSAVDYINNDLQCFVDLPVNLVFFINEAFKIICIILFFLKKKQKEGGMAALHAIVNVPLAYMKYLLMSSQTERKEINVMRVKKKENKSI